MRQKISKDAKRPVFCLILIFISMKFARQVAYIRYLKKKSKRKRKIHNGRIV